MAIQARAKYNNEPRMEPAKALPLDWLNISLLALVHVVGLGGTAAYVAWGSPSWAAVVIAVALTGMTIFSISAGYHRLFSHRTYEAHPVLRLWLLAFGAGAFQNTALAWATDHRRHHARTDGDLDPYAAPRGFWYSHVGWVLRKTDPTIKPTPVLDLERDPLVRWQKRHYALIGVCTGVVLPTALGWAFGDPWGGFVLGAALRLMVSYHATFSINSVAHLLGKQPYSDANSSRDSVWTAIISMGEGYHNFHHTFPSDYRNGVRRHQYDPTKWAIRALSFVGITKNLRRTPAAKVVRARLKMDEMRLARQELPPAALERLAQIKAALDHALSRWSTAMAQYEERKREATHQAREMLRQLAAEIRLWRYETKLAYESWKRALRSPELAMVRSAPRVLREAEPAARRRANL